MISSWFVLAAISAVASAFGINPYVVFFVGLLGYGLGRFDQILNGGWLR